MKKHAGCGLLALIFIAGLLLSSCRNDGVDSNNTSAYIRSTTSAEIAESIENTVPTDSIQTTNPIETVPSYADDSFYKDFVIDDLKSLDSITAYDISELDSFFKNPSRCEGDELIVPTFNEVNDRFPVEIIRTGYYSVYRVTQGGYYYVFWIMPYDVDGEPLPNFTTYLSSDRSPEMFASITPGVSTVGDVEKIDPNCEIFTLASSGIWVYCYINPETVLAFQCTHYDTDVLNSVVNTVHLISREKSAYFSVIQPKDLP